MSIQERITQFIELKGITAYRFCKDLGLSMGYLDKRGAIGTDKYLKIIEYFSDLNPEWLLTGKGSMLAEDSKGHSPEPSGTIIPMYDDVSSIGGTNLVADTAGVSQPSEWINAGDWFRDATAAIKHYGDSMVEYPSGSILALKEVQDKRLIFWGRNYSIETTEGRITKRLQKGKTLEFVCAYSSNKETYPDGTLIHQPIDIPLDAISRIFLVLGCVTKEYSSGSVGVNINR